MFGFLIFHDWFQPIRMRTCGETDSTIFLVLCRPCTAQSSCLSLSEVDCFLAACNETLLQSFNIFYASKNVCILSKLNFHALHAFWSYYTFLLVALRKVLKPKGHFHWKWIPVFLTVSSVPVNHKHRDSTVFQSSTQIHVLRMNITARLSVKLILSMCTSMFKKICPLWEPFPTSLTAERPVSCMAATMHYKISTPWEAFATYVTLVRFITSMCAEMINQMSILWKPFPTNVTLEWFMARVGAWVCNQVAPLGVRFPTNETFEGFLTCMRTLMVNEIPSTWESFPTNVTLERLISSVSTSVRFKIFWTCKSFPTNITFERLSSGVSTAVFCKIPALREALTTHLTYERFFSCMSASMIIKIAILWKSPTTDFTFERSITCVNTAVTNKIVDIWKVLPTDVTSVTFVISMFASVSNKLWTVWEFLLTNITYKRINCGTRYTSTSFRTMFIIKRLLHILRQRTDSPFIDEFIRTVTLNASIISCQLTTSSWQWHEIHHISCNSKQDENMDNLKGSGQDKYQGKDSILVECDAVLLGIYCSSECFNESRCLHVQGHTVQRRILLLPWKWNHNNPSKHEELHTQRHTVKSQKSRLFSITTVRPSQLTSSE